MQIIVDRFVGDTVERLRIYDAEQFVGRNFIFGYREKTIAL